MIDQVSCVPPLRESLARVVNWLGADVALSSRPAADALPVSPARWDSPGADLLQLDDAVHRLEANRRGIALHLADGSARPHCFFEQVLTRYQRLLPLRRSPEAGLARALDEHRRLFDLSKPLVRADFDHALDTWRWTLRLDLGASRALQLAALFHDVERLSSEADRRVEHLAPSYVEFKQAHARAGAGTAGEVLSRCGLPEPVIRRTVELIERHEVTSEDDELAALNDADALSFFSLNSSGFVEYFGESHTRTKVRYTLARMRPAARRYLQRLHYHPRVKALLEEELHSRAGVNG